MRRSLSVPYLLIYADGTNIAEQAVCGRIEWDASADSRVPQLVIDGHEVSWAEFRRMLMSFERWQFRLSIHYRSDEAGGKRHFAFANAYDKMSNLEI
jgi:hypothetical protein